MCDNFLEEAKREKEGVSFEDRELTRLARGINAMTEEADQDIPRARPQIPETHKAPRGLLSRRPDAAKRRGSDGESMKTTMEKYRERTDYLNKKIQAGRTRGRQSRAPSGFSVRHERR
mmetsp:Transcript_42969/g.67389  ORF Transcript_42969/g.67389 Transcript_42969/m.67389 type:complete len:118 (+) Transcript_42969:176-529(+)